MFSPSDPICSLGALCFDELDVDFECAITQADEPRASVQRRLAYELGMDFRDVRVLARYIRIFSRQEVWDRGAKDDWVNLWMFQRNIGYYFSVVRQVDLDCLPAGYYKDEEHHAWAEGGPAPKAVVLPQAALVVPDDWEPPERFEAYEFVDKDDPRPYVHKIWLCDV